MATMHLTTDNFEQAITDNQIVVIDFWAQWCAPCLSFSDTYENVSERFNDVLFTKVNIDEEAELAGSFNIRSIPQLIILKEEIAIFSESGTMPESSLIDLVEQARKADVSEIKKQIENN